MGLVMGMGWKKRFPAGAVGFFFFGSLGLGKGGLKKKDEINNEVEWGFH